LPPPVGDSIENDTARGMFAALSTVTTARGTTAPDGSVTSPTIVAASCCAAAGADGQSSEPIRNRSNEAMRVKASSASKAEVNS